MSRTWTAGVGVAAVVAGSTLAALAPHTAQAVAATVSPPTGPSNGQITINAPAGTFRTSTGTLRIGNTANVVNTNAIQFSTTACPTTAGTVPSLPRQVTDITTNATTTIVSGGNALFSAADVGRAVYGTQIPAGATIASVTNATTAVLSAAATGSTAGSATLRIGVRKVADLATTSGSTTVTSATAGFHQGDVGASILSPNLGATGNVITAVTNSTTAVVTTAATATGSSQTATISTLGPSYGVTSPATNVTVISGSKLLVKAPQYMSSLAGGTTYNVCVYDNQAGSAATVLANGTYKVYTAPTITDVSTTSGPTAGGSSITVTGTNVSAAAKVTIGGTSLDNPIVSVANGTVTGTVPAHAAGDAPIVLSTEGGPVTYGTLYTFLDGLDVSPRQLSSSSSTILDIFGSGFTDPSLAYSDFALPTAITPTGSATVAASDTITLSATGVGSLVVGDRVKLGTVGATIGGLVSGGTYWVTSLNGTALKLSLTPGGTPVDITGATGTISAFQVVTRLGSVSTTAATFTDTGDVVGWSAHGLVVGDVVRFSGALPGTNASFAVKNNIPYYVVGTPGTNSFQISDVKGGPAIDFTDDGTAALAWHGDAGTHLVVALGSYDPNATPGTAGAVAAECTGAGAISDQELICNLSTPSLAPGNYQVALLDNVLQGGDRSTIVTSTSSLTSGPY
ncbi:beta strand repeat-containing protein [Cryptosporangium sp. NPDC051539]|uniref:beta strand repeat-containing protein n=1 Tax=Cryptosporangium sp. NPDC051539 TaxID=3363962 RepID=UPI0037B6D5F7